MSHQDTPLVSLITPTMDRDHYLALQLDVVRNQTYPNIEWLIHDNSHEPSRALCSLDDDQVRYSHDPGSRSIGLKRNSMIKEAAGDIIIHIDDDDYYAPDYVERMVAELSQGHDLVKLSGFFLYSVIYQRLGYWDLSNREDICQVWSPGPLSVVRQDPKRTDIFEKNYWGFGFSYAYRRELGLANPFPDMDWGEDAAFITEARKTFNCHAFADEQGLVLHILHEANTSKSFPQYMVPDFFLGECFPGVPQAFLSHQSSKQT